MIDLTPQERIAAVRVLARRYSELECWRLISPDTIGRFNTPAVTHAQLRERQQQIAKWNVEAQELRAVIGKLTGLDVPMACGRNFIEALGPLTEYRTQKATAEKTRIYNAIMHPQEAWAE